VINCALQTKQSDASTHWSARSLAAETGISKSTVNRWLKIFSLEVHLQKNFKISTYPFFVEKVRDIVGLYLNPPDKAVVLCVDEKTQVQALDRTQPVLPMGQGYVAGVSHDYVRYGMTTLFAALDVATGEVVTQCKPCHRHQEFLAFLREIEKSVPTELDLHLFSITLQAQTSKGESLAGPANPFSTFTSPQLMLHGCRRSRPEAIPG
jgi:putative transposase